MSSRCPGRNGSSGCRIHRIGGAWMPGFFTDLAKKDLSIAIDTAKAKNMPMILSNIGLELLQAASNVGLGKKDYASLTIVLRRLSGLLEDNKI